MTITVRTGEQLCILSHMQLAMNVKYVHMYVYVLMLLYGICALNYAMQFVTDFITEGSLSLRHSESHDCILHYE